jgi:translocator protein
MDYLLQTWPTWATLLAFLAATFSAGVSGALFRPGLWYRGLSKPAWTPPDALFPVAWTLLYLAMAVAVWWVALSPSTLALPALALWSWQLVLNALWTPVFFGLRRPGAGMVVMAVLWVVAALATWTFWQISTLSGALMLAYLAWLTYAAALNLAIWRMNPGPALRAPAE